MSSTLVQKPNLENAEHLTLVIGMSCRNVRGFLYMWVNLLGFILATKNADGCTQILPGLSSPFKILLVSYWSSYPAMMKFVGSKPHKSWMRFIYKHPNSMNLFNETYAKPQSANYINKPSGYAASLEKT